MIVTISWLRENYKKFNAFYFNNELPDIEFKIGRSKKTWGFASYRYNLTRNTVTPTSITLSNYFDSPEQEKLHVLLHEMIHIYDYTINPHHFVSNHHRVRYDAHGSWFKGQCARLNKDGWNIEKFVSKEAIASSQMSSKTVQLRSNKIATAVACVITGSTSVSYVLKTSMKDIDVFMHTLKNTKWIPSFGKLVKIEFYDVNNESFATKRSCRKSLCGIECKTTEKLKTTLNKINAVKIEGMTYDLAA